MEGFKNFITGLLSFILSTIIYLAEVSLLLIFSVYSILSYRTINTLIQNIEIKQIISEINTNGKLMQSIYKVAHDANISNETIDEFLSSEEVKSMFAEYINAAASFIITGSERDNIKVSDLVNNTREKFVTIMNEENTFLTLEDREKAEKLIDDVSIKLIEYLPEISTITDGMNETLLSFVRGIFSGKTIIVLIMIIITLTILIALLRHSIINWCLWLGTTTFFASLIGIVVAFAPLFDFSSLTHGLPLYIDTLINSGVRIISSNFFIIGLIYLIISISLFSLYYLYTLRKEKSLKES